MVILALRGYLSAFVVFICTTKQVLLSFFADLTDLGQYVPGRGDLRTGCYSSCRDRYT